MLKIIAVVDMFDADVCPRRQLIEKGLSLFGVTDFEFLLVL